MGYSKLLNNSIVGIYRKSVCKSSYWSNVKLAPPDAILGVTDAFKRDQNPNKINLGVGAYRTDEGKPFVLECVKKAEQLISAENLDKEYAAITGLSEFCEASVRLLLGDDSTIIKNKLYGCSQTLSGTGGLRVGAEFLKNSIRLKRQYGCLHHLGETILLSFQIHPLK